MTVRAETEITLTRVDDGSQGADGTTFTPSVNAQGDISWTNDGGKTNPPTQNIKGPQGIQGPTGPSGRDGVAWYATCDTAAATTAKVATITPATTDFSLTTGVQVNVRFTNTNSGAVGSLTLNVNSTGALPIKYHNNGSFGNLISANQLTASSIIGFIYDGTNWVVDTTNYNANDTDRDKWSTPIKAAAAITAAHIIAGTSSGYKQLAANLAFDISYPILYASSAISSGSTGDNNWRAFGNWSTGVNFSTTGTITSATAGKVIYLKGTLNGSTFTIASSGWLTCAVPTTKDNFAYIPLGALKQGSTTNGVFESNDKVYAYKGGKFQEVGFGYASAHITEIDDDGITVHADNNTTTDYLQIDSDGVDIVKGGVSVAYYGDYARVGQDGAARAEIASSGLYLYDNKGISAISAESSGAQMPMDQKYGGTVVRKVSTGTTYNISSRSDVVSGSEILFYPYNYTTSQYEAAVSCTQGVAKTISNKTTDVSGVTVTYTVTSTSSTDIKITATYTNASNTRVSTKFKYTYKVYTDAPLIGFNGVLSINGNALTDFVVEQGVENTWTYRKWYSGKRECWATASYTGKLSTSNGGWYCDSSSGVTIPNYPTGLFTSQPYQYVSAVCDGSSTNVDACIMGANRSLTNFGNVLLHRGNSYTTSRTYIIYMHAIQL